SDLAKIERNNELSVAKASPSISSIISGAQTFAFNYFTSKFPKNYFKSTYVDTSLNSNNFNSDPGAGKLMPRIAMTTNFELGDTFMQELPYWHTTQYYIIKNLKRNYNMIFEDEENDIRIFSVPQRHKFNFNFNISVQTQISAWNVLNFINQNFESGGYNYVNGIRIPAEIPKLFIHNIARKMNIDLNTKRGQQEIRDYLMTHALGPIEGKVNPSTGNNSFKFDYTTNVLLNYPDISSYEKEISNLISKKSSVRYAMSVELWSPASFILQIKNDREIIKDIGSGLGEDDVYQFTVAVEHDVIPRENEIGMKYLLKQNFEPEMNVSVDRLGLEPILTEEVINSLREVRKVN